MEKKMSEQKKKNRVTIGQIKEFEKSKAKYLELGKTFSKDPKYNFTVDVRITYPNGEKLTLTNPKFWVNDPRDNSANPEKIPKFIVAELNLMEEKDNK